MKGGDKGFGFNFTKQFADGGVAGLLGERTGYSEGNGVADKDAQQKKFSERVIKLMEYQLLLI